MFIFLVCFLYCYFLVLCVCVPCELCEPQPVSGVSTAREGANARARTVRCVRRVGLVSPLSPHNEVSAGDPESVA